MICLGSDSVQLGFDFGANRACFGFAQGLIGSESALGLVLAGLYLALIGPWLWGNKA